MVNLLVCWLVSIQLLVDWFVGLLVGCLSQWVVKWLVGLLGWLVGLLGWLVDGAARLVYSGVLLNGFYSCCLLLLGWLVGLLACLW